MGRVGRAREAGMETDDKAGIGRREFIGAAAAALFAGVAIQIVGCSDSTSSGPGITDAVGDISENHSTPHSAIVTKVQIETGGTISIDITGKADHTHTLTLTPDYMDLLKAKEMVMQVTNEGGSPSHQHMVMFNHH
jgi:hypothetical protein